MPSSTAVSLRSRFARGLSPILAALLLVSGLASPARAADATKPHRNQGIVKPFVGKPTLPTLSAEDRATHAKGRAVRHARPAKGPEDHGVGTGVAVIDVHAPSDVVWHEVADVGGYARVIENMKEAEVYERKGNHVKARFIVGALGLNAEYFIDHTILKDDKCITWSLDYSRLSDIDESVGYWCLQDVPEKPGWTRLYYSIQTKMGGIVPGFIEDMIKEQGLNKATDWVKRESEKTVAKTG